MDIYNVSTLYEEYGNIIKMCRGTSFENKPWECIKRKSGEKYTDHPVFSENDINDEFAVAILRDRPVFYGDMVYSKSDNRAVTVVTGYYNEDKIEIYYNNSTAVCDYYDFVRDFSWELNEQKQPPSRIFKLNGIKLPCPSEFDDYDFYYSVAIDSEVFCFDNEKQAALVREALIDILTEARDKP